MSVIEFAGQLSDLRTVSTLFAVPGEVITAQSSEYARAQFAAAQRDGAPPLVIPAHNEAERLPGTLLAAAQTGNVVPIVIDNNSSDETAGIGAWMGAIVVEQPTGKKMAATQTGLRYCTDELGVRTILFTDADTHVLRLWPGVMKASVERADQGHGSAVFGNSIYTRVDSLIVCAAMNGLRTVRNFKRVHSGQPPAARGHNYALHLDRAGAMEAALYDLDPNMMGYDDGAIDAAIRKAGAHVVGSCCIDTWVVSHGDRIATLRQMLRATFDRAAYARERKRQYQADYGDDIVMDVPGA